MNKQKYCTFYVVRHAESESNISGFLGGDPHLTVVGKEQARKLAKKLGDIHIDAFFASDLLRAKETAEILALERKLAVQTTVAIRERNHGILDGRRTLEIDKEFGELFAKREAMAQEERAKHRIAEGVETDEEVITRFITYLRELAVGYAGKTVLVVSHGYTMRSFLVHIGFAQYEELPTHAITNTSYAVVQSDGTDFFVKETLGIHKK